MPSLTKVQTGFMEAQGALPLSSGTAAAPGLKFDDHAGTGMFSPSTGEIAFSTSGHSQAVTFKTDGKVGIGTDNPSRKLEIFDTAATVLQLNSTNTGGTSLRIQNSGTDKMYMGLAGDFIVGQGNNVTDSAIRASGSLLFASGGGTERLRIDSSGDVLVNHTSSLGSGKLQSYTNTQDGIDILAYSSTATNGGRLTFYRSKSNTIGNSSEVANSDSLGRIDWRGYNDDGTSNNLGAIIEAVVSGDIDSTTDMPSDLLFKTSSNGSSSPTERLRITSDGNLQMSSTGRIFVGNGGNATDPMFANVSDTNTGIAFPDADTMMFTTGGGERLRIASDGKVYFGNYASPGAKSYILKETSGSYKFNIFASESTTDNRVITVNSRSNVEALRISSNAIPRVGINTTGPNALLTVGPVDSPTFYRGTAAIKATNDDNSIDTCLYLEEASGAEGWQLSVASNGELNFHNSGASTSTLKLGDDDLVTARALHVTHNITPTSGRGVEIFEAATGVGQISSYNRDANGWDELRIKGSEVKIYTGTSNGLGLNLAAAQSTLYGTSDGILNLDSTNAGGSFMRFKQSGTTKCWVGSAEQMGGGTSSPNQDDLGLRATRNILFSANGAETLRITSGGVTNTRRLATGSMANTPSYTHHQLGYMGDYFPYGCNAVYYLAQTSTGNSGYSSHMFSWYDSGHWGHYGRFVLFCQEASYIGGFAQRYLSGTTVNTIINGGQGGSVSTTQTQTGSGTHGGQSVHRYDCTVSHSGTYRTYRWYLGLMHGCILGVTGSGKTQAEAQTYANSNGSLLHLFGVSDSNLTMAPNYRTW